MSNMIKNQVRSYFFYNLDFIFVFFFLTFVYIYFLLVIWVVFKPTTSTESSTQEKSYIFNFKSELRKNSS